MTDDLPMSPCVIIPMAPSVCTPTSPSFTSLVLTGLNAKSRNLLVFINLRNAYYLNYTIWPCLCSQESTCFQTQRSWVQILARYSEWHSHDNNVGCLVRLKTSFELNPVIEGKQGTCLSFPYMFSSCKH